MTRRKPFACYASSIAAKHIGKTFPKTHLMYKKTCLRREPQREEEPGW